LLFLLWRQWRFFFGCLASAGTAICLSVCMVGWKGVQQYVAMLTGMSLHLRTPADEFKYTASQLDMVNLRGLVTGVLRTHASHFWIQSLILILSVVVLAFASRTRVSFGLAILTAVLVSYHLIGHDASVMIIPVLLALSSP